MGGGGVLIFASAVQYTTLRAGGTNRTQNPGCWDTHLTLLCDHQNDSALLNWAAMSRLGVVSLMTEGN